VTRQLADAGTLLDIAVHDHVIIGSGTDAYTSLARRGAI
jgi:DNA repair protein RadC